LTPLLSNSEFFIDNHYAREKEFRTFIHIFQAPNFYPQKIAHQYFDSIFNQIFWQKFIRDGGIWPHLAYHCYHYHHYSHSYLTPAMSAFFNHTATNFKANQILRKIDMLLKPAKISFAILKGKILAELYYCHAGCRPYGDIDLFIDESDRFRIQELLLGQEWKMMFHSNYHQADHDTYINPNGYIVEFHWQLHVMAGSVPFLSIPAEALKKNWSPVFIEKHLYYTLQPELHFISNMLNWMKRPKFGWPPLKYFDLYYILQRTSRDRILELAQNFNMVEPALYFINEIHYYFCAGRIHTKKPVVFSLIKEYRSENFFYFIRIRWYWRQNALKFIRDIVRLLFPDQIYLKKFYHGVDGRLLCRWWKEKATQFFRRLRLID